MPNLIALFIVAFCGTGILAALCRLVPPAERNWLVRILLIAFAIRIAVATLFAFIPEIRFFHEDAEGYEWIGMRLAAVWAGHAQPWPLPSANYGFFYVGGAVYSLLGPASAALSYFNSIVGGVVVFLVYLLAREFVQPMVARRAALFAAFMPSMVLWSAIAIKDPLMSLLILVALIGCVHLKKKFSIGALLLTGLPIVAIQPLRFYMVYFLTIAVLGALLLERGGRSITGLYKQVAVIGVLLGILVVAGLSGGAKDGLDSLSLERVSNFRHGMATTAQSGFMQDVDVSTPAAAILFLPVGIATLLFAPFPWQMTSVRAALAAPEMIVWWALIPSLVVGIRFAIKRRWREMSPLLLFAVAMTVAYSLIHGNVGSAFRQRTQIFVLLFILNALGGYVRRCRRRGVDPELLLVGPDGK